MVMVMVVVGEDVLHHVKGRGNCPGGEMSGERAVRNVSRGNVRIPGHCWGAW